MGLTYDFHNLPELSPELWHRATSAYAMVQGAKRDGRLGFTKLPHADVSELLSMASDLASEVEAVLVIGIGGSDLGARAVHRALNHQFYNQLPADRRPGPRLYFVGDTTDPLALEEVLDIVDLDRTAVVIISKSGNTIEQMSTFIFLQERLRQAVDAETLCQRIIVITDAERGTLREIVNKEGYRSLSVPGDVGGRFSVLSSVGLFVLAVTGIDVQDLLAGAAWLDSHIEAGAESDPALRFAADQYAAVTEHGQPISVLMPYYYSLREFGFWYRQLWAESLGKRMTRDGQLNRVGPTPIASLGPTDQHSQLQLYREGPRDKVVTMVSVEEVQRDAQLPAAYPDLEGVSYLKGHYFGEILHAEQASTAAALAADARPSSLISIERLDAFHLGALIYFFELATAYSGELYDIDAYDQPGVELSKDIMFGLLERPGYQPWEMDRATDDQKISLS